jgi:hypothetical protein
MNPVVVVVLAIVGMVGLWFMGEVDTQMMLVVAWGMSIPLSWVVVRYVVKGKDFDIFKRTDRVPLYLLSIVSISILAGYVWWMGEDWFLKLLWLLLTVIVFGVVNNWYKISVHAGMMSGLVTLVVSLLGIQSWGWLWIAPLTVAWSRVVLGKHTVGQVLLGISLPPSIFLIFFG